MAYAAAAAEDEDVLGWEDAGAEAGDVGCYAAAEEGGGVGGGKGEGEAGRVGCWGEGVLLECS